MVKIPFINKKVKNPLRGRTTLSHQGPTHSTTTETINPLIQEQTNKLIPRAEAEYRQNRVTPFNPIQRDAMERGLGNIGLGEEKLQRARDLFEKGARDVGEANYQQYLLPIQKQQDEIQRNLWKQVQDNLAMIDSQYGAAGRYGSAGSQRERQEALNNYFRTAALLQEEMGNNALREAWNRAGKDIENAQTSAGNFLNLGDVGRRFANEDFLTQMGIGGLQQAQAQKEALAERENLNQFGALLGGLPSGKSTRTDASERKTFGNRGHRVARVGSALLNFMNRQPVNLDDEGQPSNGGESMGESSGGFRGTQQGSYNSNQDTGFLSMLSRLFNRQSGSTGSPQSIILKKR